MCPSGRLAASSATTIRIRMETDFRPAFDVLDIDRDGKISKDDLRTFYSGLYGSSSNNTTATATASDEDIGSMISVADSNKNGFVEFDEFNQVLNCTTANKTSSSPTMAVNGGLMEDVFKVMDRDGDGKVGFNDLKSYFEWAGFPATDDEDIKTMIKLGGGDADGVCYEGLVKILAL